MDRASHAVTRFSPLKKDDETDGNYELVRYTPRLGARSEVLEGDKEVVVRLEAPASKRRLSPPGAGDTLVRSG